MKACILLLLLFLNVSLNAAEDEKPGGFPVDCGATLIEEIPCDMVESKK